MSERCQRDGGWPSTRALEADPWFMGGQPTAHSTRQRTWSLDGATASDVGNFLGRGEEGVVRAGKADRLRTPEDGARSSGCKRAGSRPACEQSEYNLSYNVLSTCSNGVLGSSGQIYKDLT